MLTALKMYLDEAGFETQIYGTCLSVKDPSNALGIESDSQFVMVGQSPTKISICYDEDTVDVADPDSLPFIAKVVKYCKESNAQNARWRPRENAESRYQ